MSAEPLAGAERLTSILKAYVIGADVADPAQRSAEAPAWASLGVLEPPYDPQTLATIYEHSSGLRPNVDAYATNIDGFGHRFEPVIDFDAEDAGPKVADALRLERAFHAQRDGGLPAAPTDAALTQQVAELANLARAERAFLEAFFDGCCFDHSFVALRRRTRQDLEVTGNAYWEVLRTGAGQLGRFVHVPAHTVRLLPLEQGLVEVAERVRISPIAFDRVTVRRPLRRFVQRAGGGTVFFKQLGDPRIVSRNTGRVCASVEELIAADPHDAPATELLHFAIASPCSPYGVPRWIGALLSVLGSREMEEVNYLFFSNRSVPPLAILVSGGRINESSVPRIERFIDENIKGKGGFHRILVLEADAGSGENKAKIEMVPLAHTQQTDQLFGAYDQANVDKVGANFRLPRLLRGDSRDMNRSTAESALRFAEEQVFQPERDEFDHLVNRTLLGDLGIRFWRFRSNAPLTRDPERMTAMVAQLVHAGVLTPEEGRVLAGDIFNRDFRVLGDDWTKRPITLTLAGIQSQNVTVDQVAASPAPHRLAMMQDAKFLVGLGEELRAEEARLAARRLALARAYLDTPGTIAGADHLDHASPTAGAGPERGDADR
jgi:PBSX family phage portal protein